MRFKTILTTVKKMKTLTATALVLVATSASAGLYQPFPVEVDLDLFQANGDLLSARNSKSKTVFIGCGTRVIDDGLGGVIKFGFCQAEDHEGDEVACSTQNSGLVDAISASADRSFVTFSWDEVTLECTRIGFSNQSFYLGKSK